MFNFMLAQRRIYPFFVSGFATGLTYQIFEYVTASSKHRASVHVRQFLFVWPHVVIYRSVQIVHKNMAFSKEFNEIS